MGLRINTNIEALSVHKNLVDSNTRVGESLKRLSSGLRINSARDDAAGFAIANSFKAKISSMRVATQNATEAQSMLQTADGAYTQIHDILIRMKELATECASGEVRLGGETGEFTAMQAEIDRIANSTRYGDTTLVNGSGIGSTGITFQVGATNDPNNRVVVTFKGATSDCMSVSSSTVKIDTLAHAQAAMDAIDAALTSINGGMGEIGAFQNRLQYTIQNLAVSIENYSVSESAIRDVDMADEISRFSKNQILQQSGMAMLAQANSAPQQILTLLR